MQSAGESAYGFWKLRRNSHSSQKKFPETQTHLLYIKHQGIKTND